MAILTITNLDTATYASTFGPVPVGGTRNFQVTTAQLVAALSTLNTDSAAGTINYCSSTDPSGMAQGADALNYFGTATINSLVAASQTISGDIVVDDITCDDIAADAITATSAVATGAVQGATVVGTTSVTGAAVVGTNTVTGAAVVGTNTVTTAALVLNGTAPIKTASSTNTVTKANFVAAWGHITTDGVGGVVLDDGFNTTSVAVSAGSILVTLGTDFATANYGVQLTAAGLGIYIPGVSAQAAGTFTASLADATGTPVDLAVTAVTIHFSCTGRQ